MASKVKSHLSPQKETMNKIKRRMKKYAKTVTGAPFGGEMTGIPTPNLFGFFLSFFYFFLVKKMI